LFKVKHCRISLSVRERAANEGPIRIRVRVRIRIRIRIRACE